MVWFERFTLACAWLAAILFVASGCMLTYEVAARYFFTQPTIWAAELSQFCLIWGSLAAMPWVLSARRHIAVDAVVRLLPDRGRRACEIFAMAVVAVFSVFVLIYGFEIFWDSYQRGSTTGSMLEMPRWVPELAVPFGFALLLVQSIIELRKAVAGHLPDEEQGPQE